MNNRKGFTLIELLVAITIIGIIMLMVLPAITNLQRENQKKKFDDYERAVLEAAKAYEDQYEEDLFGRFSEGCAYIDYKNLVDKKLLSTTKISGYECNYDTNGIIIRKVKGKSFYEVYLDCVKGSETKKLTSNSGYKSISRDYCDVGEDKTPPTLEIKCDSDTINGVPGDDFNETGIYYYSSTNKGNKKIPELTVKASDSNSGLEKNQYVTYEWKIYTERKDQELNGNPNYTEKNKTIFNTKDGAGSTSKKKVRIIEAFKENNTTGKAIIDLSGENIVDRAGNKLSLEADSATKTCTYYYDNVKPQMNITITGNNTGTSYNTNSEYWINEPITTTVTVTDQTENGIYSGIDSYSLTRGENKETLTGGTATYTFTKEDANRNEDDTYTICDKVGNCTSQTVKIRVDTTPPTCGEASSKATDKWTNKTRTVTVRCIDTLSKCKRNPFSEQFGEDSLTGIITIEDNARNTTKCTVYTKVDKTDPVCTSYGGDNGWRTNPLTINGTCTDNLSGCVQNTYANSYSGNVNITDGFGGRACDEANNCADCTKNQTVHIDNTSPYCYFDDISNERVAGEGVNFVLFCEDNYAVKNCDRWSYSYQGTTYDGTELSGEIYDTRAGQNMMNQTQSMEKETIDMAGNRATCFISITPAQCNKCPESCCPNGSYKTGNRCCMRSGGNAGSLDCFDPHTCYTATCSDPQYCGYIANQTSGGAPGGGGTGRNRN